MVELHRKLMQSRVIFHKRNVGDVQVGKSFSIPWQLIEQGKERGREGEQGGRGSQNDSWILLCCSKIMKLKMMGDVGRRQRQKNLNYRYVRLWKPLHGCLVRLYQEQSYWMTYDSPITTPPRTAPSSSLYRKKFPHKLK